MSDKAARVTVSFWNEKKQWTIQRVVRNGKFIRITIDEFNLW